MRQKSILRAAALAAVLAFGAVTVAPIAPAYADGIEGIRGGVKKKPAPKRKPKPAPVQQAPAPAPMVPAPVVPTGPQELTLPSSFFEGSGGVGVNITGGGGYGGGVVIVTQGGGASYSGFAGRGAFFTGSGKGC
jgi:hypothetical protein